MVEPNLVKRNDSSVSVASAKSTKRPPPAELPSTVARRPRKYDVRVIRAPFGMLRGPYFIKVVPSAGRRQIVPFSVVAIRARARRRLQDPSPSRILEPQNVSLSTQHPAKLGSASSVSTAKSTMKVHAAGVPVGAGEGDAHSDIGLHIMAGQRISRIQLRIERGNFPTTQSATFAQPRSCRSVEWSLRTTIDETSSLSSDCRHPSAVTYTSESFQLASSAFDEYE